MVVGHSFATAHGAHNQWQMIPQTKGAIEFYLAPVDAPSDM